MVKLIHRDIVAKLFRGFESYSHTRSARWFKGSPSIALQYPLGKVPPLVHSPDRHEVSCTTYDNAFYGNYE